MQYDIHERREDGGVGRLLDVIDRQPEHHSNGQFVEFDGDLFPVLTGLRDFIIVPATRWAEASAGTWRKA
ncbi:hypothetical protein [Pseudomonas vancouverensis]|uniref:Uncharacterized protein n=1 Tax=Pseudomonas vancouverensis TaxID=95300 RepID=A0A1H2MTZ2_PSEVA|nr:hypothetical protein [Pseudomonas vancouverensis]KAB0489740.1 hypothetical protein F7R09_28915 [Pseudomonas vancouverensis]TDB67235.1 hypothetical protein EIY72_04085 [Pseudomonas vancouverensis]SDU96542.1 hypothetical protein SAMN05216558_1253 [Pseudomonas vancouverensis]